MDENDPVVYEMKNKTLMEKRGENFPDIFYSYAYEYEGFIVEKTGLVEVGKP